MPESDCLSIPCCPDDPYDYQSTDGGASQAGNNAVECPEVTVTSEPVSGSSLFFPSFVVLTASNEEADIYYTLDGTEPTTNSILYSGPFEVTQAGTMIKAAASLEGCGLGETLVVLYQNPPFPGAFDYSCITPDKVGSFDVWAPNGNIDSFWQLEFTLTGNQVIKRLEMRQLSSSGGATTGIFYSTDSPVDGVDAMPLGLFIAAVQQHTDYQSSLGTFGAATHTWDLYGEKRFSSDGGFFQFTMVLGDGSRVTAIKRTNCNNIVNPQPCSSPAAPTAAPDCDGEVDVTFANSNPQNYKVYYQKVGQNEVLFQTGTTSANPQAVTVTGLTPGAQYFFRVELDFGNPCGFQSSIPVTAVPLPDPVVTIATNKTIVDPNESFTISWTSTNIGGGVCGGCLDGQVSINQGLGCKAGNASDSQATSQATPGVYTYEITGCNTCGTATASVQVEVRNLATCSVQPAIINVNVIPASFLCAHIPPPGTACSACLSIFPIDVVWNGEVPRVSSCFWSIHAVGGCDSGTLTGGSPAGSYIPFAVHCRFLGGIWIFQIGTQSEPVNGCFWTGEKLFGNSPLGTYTRTGGCATGPASITIT